MANFSLNLTVVDVYDIAASIGKEFEDIIDVHGPKVVTDLMPKVIRTLEHLEALTSHHQKENYELEELRFAITKLQTEKIAKAEDRARFEKEIEQIEDAWHKETRELVKVISSLKDDNRKLIKSLQDEQSSSTKSQCSTEEEQNVLMDIKKICQDQREELRKLRNEISSKNGDIEALQSQLERITKLNAEYRRKSLFNAKQFKSLIQDRAEAQASLQDKEQQIVNLQEKIKKQDSVESISPTSSVSEEEMDTIQKKLSKEGKIVINLHDPNRPRFTLNELRDVLEERNELKSRALSMEEELKQYKPETNGDFCSDEEDLDRPVQGPINREPDDKLYPYKNSETGIRKFFSFKSRWRKTII